MLGTLESEPSVRPGVLQRSDPIYDDFYPMCFDTGSPCSGASEYLQDASIGLLVDFFRDKGLTRLKEEDAREDWYQDWIDYQSEHAIYASLLAHRDYSGLGHQFDLRRLTRFAEVFAYFSPAHAYSLHVSFLGLSIVLMSDNEPLKQEAIARLEAGELFALAVSERAHGADLLANEFSLNAAAEEGLLANGHKFYIGNANAAGLISVLGRMVAGAEGRPSKRSEIVFFVVRRDSSRGYQSATKIRTLGIRSAFVGEFEVRDQPVSDDDVMLRGRAAWDAVFATINLGKFILGFGAIGSCQHAFVEAQRHMQDRVLYGKRVTEIPFLRGRLVDAFARLTGMKFYANRARDYVEVAGPDERRYLLFNAVQKARVSTEGVKVMAVLSECVGAWGFEASTYFETALRDMQLFPALESSTHINFELTARFIDTYFGGSDAETPLVSPPFAAAVGESLNWMDARFRNLGAVRFAPVLDAYQQSPMVTNIAVFVAQVRVFHSFTESLPETPRGPQFVRLGRCLSVIAYAQLVAETCEAIEAPQSLVSVIFHGLIEDLADEALRLAALFCDGGSQREQLKGMVRVPRTSSTEFDDVFRFMEERCGIEGWK